MAIDLRNINPELDYPLKEVAQFLDLSYGTVLKMRKENKVKSTKIGKKYYIKGKEVLLYAEGQ